MTPKYWLKIVFGMLAIFVVGMVVVSGVRAGKSKITSVVTTADPINVPLLGLPFRTGKGELGTLKQLRVERDAPDEISGFHFVVTLSDGVDPGQFNLCEVTVGNPEHFDHNSMFDCLTAADSGFDGLVNFGTIRFEPSGATHRLMLPEHVRNEIQSAFSHDAEAAGDSAGNAAGDSVAVDASDGNVTVKVGGRTVVEIKGN